MESSIRDIKSSELHLFGEIVAKLSMLDTGVEARQAILYDVVRLMRADYASSYVWDRKKQQFGEGIGYNIEPDHASKYHRYYQYRDPFTAQLRTRQTATLVEEVAPYRALQRTEFYNDFLLPEGLRHGINLFLFDGDKDLGDFRLWRAPDSPPFGERERVLLDSLTPFLRRAMIRSHNSLEALSRREREVAFLVAKGCRDREIGALLSISFTTVRTHLRRAMEKKGCANRTELAAVLAREEPNLHKFSLHHQL